MQDRYIGEQKETEIPATRPWRLPGTIEPTNNLLLLGWLTAFFVLVVARLPE